jgi:DNA-binding CsgD family transcriptional regulator/PAS domain-containing protein
MTMSTDGVLDLVGRIYDCAIDPTLWPDTIHTIEQALDAVSGGIVLFDYKGGEDRLLVRDSRAPTNSDIGFQNLLASVKPYQRPIIGLPPELIDEPMIMPQFSEKAEELKRSLFFKQWAEAQGIHQTMQTVALQEPTRLAIFGVNRHIAQGSFQAKEISLMRRLAPHVRRSFVISDLLGLREAESDTFASVLETIPTGICIVGGNGRILHANSAAKIMLDRKHHIQAEAGHLQGPDPATTAELHAALRKTQLNAAHIGSSGIGIPLHGSDHRLAIAHVLPLTHGTLRPQVAPQALAAVFINLGGPVYFDDLDAIARSFEFTPAETRLVSQILRGRSTSEASKALRISEATTKTHLSHIFEKTGVSRQIDLVGLMQRLLPIARTPQR